MAAHPKTTITLVIEVPASGYRITDAQAHIVAEDAARQFALNVPLEFTVKSATVKIPKTHQVPAPVDPAELAEVEAILANDPTAFDKPKRAPKAKPKAEHKSLAERMGFGK